jgi:RND family efflux transporter MFP subunit
MLSKRSLSPIFILLPGFALALLLLQGKPSAEILPTAPEPPAVQVLPAAAETVSLRVQSQGTVTPRTESELVAQVPGQLLRVGPGLEPGAFFRAGDVLAELDPRDLELAVKRARAALKRARADQEFANATRARQRALEQNGIASSAIVDETRRAAESAEARRLEAEVDLEQAQRELARTRILAPFDGRTRTRSADVGRFVSVGTSLAHIYAVDYAEVRLPIPDSDLAFLDLPLGEEVSAEAAPEVELSARFAGEEHRWLGRIVRTEAEIDPRTRMVNVVARVTRPYGAEGNAVRTPLAVGLFIDAEIIGRRVEGVIRVPRAALADDDSLWVVDADDRLRRRRVEVLRLERDTALISSGLIPSERIALLEPRLAREGAVVVPVLPEAVAASTPQDGRAS